MKKRLLIVGAGMATAYLLQALQQQRHDYAITVVGDEQDICYNRVLLSNLLAGDSREGDLQMLPPLDHVEFVAATQITRIGVHARIAFAADGRSFAYEKLVLATGANVALPAADSADLEGAMVFRSLADTRKLRAMDSSGQRAVVIGGGLLGLEAAHGLAKLGFDTRVVHRNPVLMNRQLDQRGGRELQRQLEQKGMQFHLGSALAQVHASGNRVTAVALDDGTRIGCDLLLFASGIVPNAALAREAGIDTGRGVQVDAYMRTSTPGVFALGECCEFNRQCFGLVAPIRRQAQSLADYLCGSSHEGFSLEDYPTQLKISGVDIYRAGELDDEAEQIQLYDRSRGLYRRLVVRDNRLVGAVLVGDKRGGTWYSQLISQGRDISALRQGLLFGQDIAEAQLGTAA